MQAYTYKTMLIKEQRGDDKCEDLPCLKIVFYLHFMIDKQKPIHVSYNCGILIEIREIYCIF